MRTLRIRKFYLANPCDTTIGGQSEKDVISCEAFPILTKIVSVPNFRYINFQNITDHRFTNWK